MQAGITGDSRLINRLSLSLSCSIQLLVLNITSASTFEHDSRDGIAKSISRALATPVELKSALKNKTTTMAEAEFKSSTGLLDEIDVNTNPIYEDQFVTITPLGVTLRWYWFPTGSDKFVAWDDIEGYFEETSFMRKKGWGMVRPCATV